MMTPKEALYDDCIRGSSIVMSMQRLARESLSRVEWSVQS